MVKTIVVCYENEMPITIYHNPRCSKSRQALEILEKKGASPIVRQYLKDPLSKSELKNILELLGSKPSNILRKNESVAKEIKLDVKDEEKVFNAMLKYPILMERPIVVSGKRAVVGRPPENVQELF